MPDPYRHEREAEIQVQGDGSSPAGVHQFGERRYVALRQCLDEDRGDKYYCPEEAEIPNACGHTARIRTWAIHG